MATLYLIPTPIGNLEDITLRAIRILKEVDLILCEDTRTSKPLLKHFEISTPLLSYHIFNEHQKIESII
ncbi:MAG: SAM-dependent methyltransferase, partial [Bacteroidales bacterium]|nr:SAM-dependent methyltransferase [Bacteroidales bacterium]